MLRRKHRLVSIAHSYCVALNRRLVHEMAVAGGEAWEVTAVAPAFMHGDLRPIPLEAFAGEACRLEPVPAHLSGRIHLMFYGSRLREILRGPWDTVHCWEEPYVVAGAQVARWAPRESSLVYATFQNILKDYPPPFGWLERYSMQRATGWIAGGRVVEEVLLQRAAYARRPRTIIPLGVDVGEFRPDPRMRERVRRELEWEACGAPVVGYLGRFVPEKGLELLLSALERLEVPWRALFVGGGTLEGRLREWGARYGERVRVVTGVKHDEVPAYLNAMDVLCAPSQTTPAWTEQLGRMVIEAFACGVPVLASDSGEIPHVVHSAGEIVGEQDLDGWVHALSALLDDGSRRAALAAEGRERASSVYAWPVVAREHLEYFARMRDARGDGE